MVAYSIPSVLRFTAAARIVFQACIRLYAMLRY